MYKEIRMDQFVFFYLLPVEPAPFVEYADFFLLYGFNFFVKYQVTIDMWVYFWDFNSIPLIYLPFWNYSISVKN